MLLTLGLSLLIGILLGLLGGGGSILTVPMLVYVLSVDAKQAVVTSFVVVGLSSVIALLPYARRQAVCWKSGALFGVTGMGGSYLSAHLAAHFSSALLMSLFGVISAVSGLLMLLGKPRAQQAGNTHAPIKVCPLNIPFLRILFDGFWVGAVTGLVGVGGGFLIVPALTLLVGLPMQGAIGTSLLVIFMNASAGLLGYSQHIELDWQLTGWVASGAILGSLLGSWLSAWAKPVFLRKAFAYMVMLVAAYVLSQSFSVDLVRYMHTALGDPHIQDTLLQGIAPAILVIVIGLWIHRSENPTLN